MFSFESSINTFFIVFENIPAHTYAHTKFSELKTSRGCWTHVFVSSCFLFLLFVSRKTYIQGNNLWSPHVRQKFTEHLSTNRSGNVKAAIKHFRKVIYHSIYGLLENITNVLRVILNLSFNFCNFRAN